MIDGIYSFHMFGLIDELTRHEIYVFNVDMLKKKTNNRRFQARYITLKTKIRQFINDSKEKININIDLAFNRYEFIN